MIRITDVVKYHGQQCILNGATLTAKPGEMTALVGPSGGGKSTLLRCINGLEPFHSGRIEIFGHSLSGTQGKPVPFAVLQPIRRQVGMVFQQFHLFPHLTAIQNVMCGAIHAAGKSKAEAEKRAKELLAQVNLTAHADKKPASLSGGQQQRVAIARALAVDPLAILFDEPTSALDPDMVGEVLEAMRGLATRGLTMIVVTHDIDLARQAQAVCKMVAGQVVECGPPGEVLKH